MRTSCRLLLVLTAVALLGLANSTSAEPSQATRAGRPLVGERTSRVRAEEFVFSRANKATAAPLQRGADVASRNGIEAVDRVHGPDAPQFEPITPQRTRTITNRNPTVSQ